jgi:hypothetical protein
LQGENPDVDPQIAAKWIADGNAVYDSDGQQDAPSAGSGVTWVQQNGQVVGILGPDGTTVYAQFVRQPDGSVQMQIVPRTGTLQALLATAGSAGELSSATDVNAIVQHNGVGGQARAFFANVVQPRVSNVTGTGSQAHPALASSYPIHVITKDAAVTAVSNFGQVTSGTVVGQTVTIINSTGISCGLELDGVTGLGNVPTGGIVEAKWTGTTWIRTAFWSGVSTGIVLGAGTATVASAVAVGGGNAAGAGSVTLGGGSATGQNAIAFKGSTASGTDSLAIKGLATAGNAVAIGGAKAFVSGSLGLLVHPTNGAAARAQEIEFCLARQLAAGDVADLSLDGLSDLSGNMLRADLFSGAAILDIRIRFIENPANRAVFWNYCVALRSDGTTLTLLGVNQIGTPSVFGNFAASGGIPVISFSVGTPSQTFRITADSSATDYDGDIMATCRLGGWIA